MTKLRVLYDGPIVNRAEAKEKGLSRYFTGKPCKHGHVSERYVHGGCIECGRVRDELPKIIKEAKEVFYHGPVVSYRQAKENGDTYYFTGEPCKHGHVDKRLTSDCGCMQCKYIRKLEYRSKPENQIKSKEYSRRWRKENPEKNAAQARIYSSRKKGAEGVYTGDDARGILRRQKQKCAEPTCGANLDETGHHVDHIMPLALGGSNWPKNLQCLCPDCNRRKNSMHPLDWAKKKGRLC